MDRRRHSITMKVLNGDDDGILDRFPKTGRHQKGADRTVAEATEKKLAKEDPLVAFNYPPSPKTNASPQGVWFRK